MIHGLKPYSAMKDSGVPWLGEVPVHWQVLPNRALFAEVKDQNHSDEPLLSVTISRGVIQQTELLSETSKKDSSNLDKSKYKFVQPGDIAYNKMRAWQSAIGASQFRGIISPAYIVQRPRSGVLAEYMHYLLRTPSFATEAERWSYGITSDQWSLRPEDFKQIYCSLPPKDEQSTIVRFLDYIDRRVRKYIRAKRQLIELLNEQKQAIINRAVTRGLDPNVRLKPSGIEWLGDVPVHWEVKRLKNVCRLQRGYDLSGDNFKNGNYPVYGSNGVIGYHNSFTTKGPCITVGRSGSVGEVNYVENDFWAHNTTLYVIEHYDNNWQFLFFLLKNIDLKLVSGGSAVPTLNRNYIHQLYISVPPLHEQLQIVCCIDIENKKIDAAIARTNLEIDLIREYRTRLIADVVTGKVDVREMKLPDKEELEGIFDMEETEAFEEAEALSEDSEDAE